MEHLFVRWDDETTGTKLNIEATSPGLNCYSDEDYQTWPQPIPPEIRADGWMPRSMTPPEVFAPFYKIRANCFQDWCNCRGMLELAYHVSRLSSQAQRGYYHFHALADEIA